MVGENAEKRYTLRVPTINGFEMRYYFHNSETEDEAKTFPPHVHDRLEIYVLVEGNASFMVENRSYPLRAGDVIISKPNEVHNCILNSHSVHKHLCFWFDVTSEFLFSDFLAHNMGEGNLISPCSEDRERLLQIYHRLCEAGAKEMVYRQFYLTLEMLDILRSNLKKNATVIPIPAWLRSILDDIDENFVSIHDLTYFTEKYYISSSTLNRLFQTHIGSSPKLYLEAKKLAYSRILLKEGKSVLEASVCAGFSNCSNYIRLFKKRFYMTPAEYKNGVEIKDTDAAIL